MKKKLAILLVGTMIASSILAGCGSKKSEPTKKETSGELKGDITFWHSFTQGPRMEVIQQTADQFMKDNPGVKIKIETFSWGDFYTKWTTGLASGNVPDMSTALPGHVVEMMDADELEPVDDLIDDIGRNKFSKTALSEGKKMELVIHYHCILMRRLCGIEKIYCKKLDFLYQKLGMNLLKQQRHLQKMVFMVVLSRVVQMTLWQLDF